LISNSQLRQFDFDASFRGEEDMAKKPEAKPKETPKPQEKSGEKAGAKKGGKK
jgi:hypothetical protein